MIAYSYVQMINGNQMIVNSYVQMINGNQMITNESLPISVMYDLQKPSFTISKKLRKMER